LLLRCQNPPDVAHPKLQLQKLRDQVGLMTKIQEPPKSSDYFNTQDLGISTTALIAASESAGVSAPGSAWKVLLGTHPTGSMSIKLLISSWPTAYRLLPIGSHDILTFLTTFYMRIDELTTVHAAQFNRESPTSSASTPASDLGDRVLEVIVCSFHLCSFSITTTRTILQ